MAELVAQSDDSTQRWRRSFQRQIPVVLGRTSGWSVPWDSAISRRHARLLWDGSVLQVECFPEAHNPAFFHGQKVSTFQVNPGDFFVIGNTTFTLAQSAVGATMQMPDPAREQLFSRQVLSEVRFRDAEKRLAILSELPDLIEGATDQQELFVRLVNVIFGGVDRAVSVGVVSLDPAKESESEKSGSGKSSRRSSDRSVQVLHWDRRAADTARFQPSQRLIVSACQRQQSMLHIWEDPQALEAMTMIDSSHDWAFVTPLPGGRQRDLAIYVSGLLTPGRQSVDSISSIASSLKEDVKFTELAASIVGSLLGMQELRDAEVGLRSNLSSTAWQAIQNADRNQLLRPQWCQLTCLFSRLQWPKVEGGAEHPDVSSLWQNRFRITAEFSRRVKQAVLTCGGVVGASRGQTWLGYWGWPMEIPDAAQMACEAMGQLEQAFLNMKQQEGHWLDQAVLRMGVATGQGVAGSLEEGAGKPTVLGPVLDQQSSLGKAMESAAWQVSQAIRMVIDQQTMQQLLPVSPEAGPWRTEMEHQDWTWSRYDIDDHDNRMAVYARTGRESHRETAQ